MCIFARKITSVSGTSIHVAFFSTLAPSSSSLSSGSGEEASASTSTSTSAKNYYMVNYDTSVRPASMPSAAEDNNRMILALRNPNRHVPLFVDVKQQLINELEKLADPKPAEPLYQERGMMTLSDQSKSRSAVYRTTVGDWEVAYVPELASLTQLRVDELEPSVARGLEAAYGSMDDISFVVAKFNNTAAHTKTRRILSYIMPFEECGLVLPFMHMHLTTQVETVPSAPWSSKRVADAKQQQQQDKGALQAFDSYDHSVYISAPAFWPAFRHVARRGLYAHNSQVLDLREFGNFPTKQWNLFHGSSADYRCIERARLSVVYALQERAMKQPGYDYDGLIVGIGRAMEQGVSFYLKGNLPNYDPPLVFSTKALKLLDFLVENEGVESLTKPSVPEIYSNGPLNLDFCEACVKQRKHQGMDLERLTLPFVRNNTMYSTFYEIADQFHCDGCSRTFRELAL